MENDEPICMKCGKTINRLGSFIKVKARVEKPDRHLTDGPKVDTYYHKKCLEDVLVVYDGLLQ